MGICEKGGFDSKHVWKNSDVVTLGIAADLVPIQDENRIIVHHGIRQMNKETNLGITALQKTGGLLGKDITVGRLVFWMAPKINAAGRLGDASRAVKLLSTKNPVFANEIAMELEQENERRKAITFKITNEALEDNKINFLKVSDHQQLGAIALFHHWTSILISGYLEKQGRNLDYHRAAKSFLGYFSLKSNFSSKYLAERYSMTNKSAIKLFKDA